MMSAFSLKSATSIVTITASFGLFVSSAAAENKNEDALRLAPSSNWNLNYADDSCRIVRSFGDGDQKVIFYIEKYEPGDAFTMLAAGTPFKTRRGHAYVQFGAHEAEQKRDMLLGNLGDLEPALIFSTMRFAKSIKNDQAAHDPSDSDPDTFGQQMSVDREAAIEWVRIRPAGRDPVYLETGSLGEPMAAMRTCTGDLLTRWGIDLEKHRKLASMPKQIGSPGRWIKPSDYPTNLLRKGNQGLVKFRLSIDDTGKPTQCHIQQSTRPEGFDIAVCESLMTRARFEPARTKDGEAIASYWRNTVRFEIPR